MRNVLRVKILIATVGPDLAYAASYSHSAPTVFTRPCWRTSALNEGPSYLAWFKVVSRLHDTGRSLVLSQPWLRLRQDETLSLGSYTDACKGVSGDGEASIREYIHGGLRPGLGVGFRSFDRFTAHTTAFLKRRPVFFCGQDGGLICIRADNE